MNHPAEPLALNVLQDAVDDTIREAEAAHQAAEATQEAAEIAQAVAEAADAKRALRLKFYQDACHVRDTAIESNDLLSAIRLFESAAFFAGFYAIGEMYQHGVSRVYNGTPVRLDLNASMAANYFLKAYESYNVPPVPPAEDKEVKAESAVSAITLVVEVMGSRIKIPDLSGPFDLSLLNEVVMANAMKGHPEALYQLGLFYDQELTHYNNNKSRIGSALPNQLVAWKKACLQAAANLFHPHAAYKLVTECGGQLNADDKLKFSLIAADPNRYKDVRLTPYHESTLLTYRGNAPLTNPVVLTPPTGALPPELLVVETIGGGKMGGIFENSVRKTSTKCLLPMVHVAANSSAVASPDSQASRDQKSAEAMRAMRANKLAALANAGRTTTASVAPQSSAKVLK